LKESLSSSGTDTSQLMPILSTLKKKYDYEEHGGTPILGINGIVMKCHGSSSKRSIKNAIIAVKKFHDANLINEIAERMSNHMDIFEENTNINETQTA
jgi:fatty acid/phospholipid biosynthesis enzyme